ncbi:MAG: hypothetical protein KatS3mg111_0521 [Pirellulaceae bacterium]|nr:MAG: hypothetical protein KatS3mg111_0521 [Pirellulaceae bacterium]
MLTTGRRLGPAPMATATCHGKRPRRPKMERARVPAQSPPHQRARRQLRRQCRTVIELLPSPICRIGVVVESTIGSASVSEALPAPPPRTETPIGAVSRITTRRRMVRTDHSVRAVSGGVFATGGEKMFMSRGGFTHDVSRSTPIRVPGPQLSDDAVTGRRSISTLEYQQKRAAPQMSQADAAAVAAGLATEYQIRYLLMDRLQLEELQLTHTGDGNYTGAGATHAGVTYDIKVTQEKGRIRYSWKNAKGRSGTGTVEY